MGFDIDRDTIEKVAKIARIRLTPEQEERLLADFKEILSAFSMLDQAEADCDPAFHPIEIMNYLREDEPSLEIPPDDIIDSMDTHQRFIKGPRMQ
jgi:aspartyl-tRNA(Asn)/glutamyl-tRNA(Gln) amidotransferase subunit C